MKSFFARAYDGLEQMLLTTHACSIEGLSLYRIVYCVLMLSIISPHLVFTQPIPDYMYSPPFSLAMFFDAPPSEFTIDCLRYALAASLGLLLVGYRTFWVSMAVALLLVLINTASFSAGKINHSILTVIVPLTLAFSPWGDRFSLDEVAGRPKSRETAIPMGMLALIIAIAMGTAAYTKFKSGWLSLDSSAVRHYVYDFWFIRDRGIPSLESVIIQTPNWFWELQDWLTVLFEFAGLVAVYRARWFAAWLITACVFHLGVSIMLGIHFHNNLIAYAAFYPWVLLLPRSLCVPRANDLSLHSRRPTLFSADAMSHLCAIGVAGLSMGMLVGIDRWIEFLSVQKLMSSLVIYVPFIILPIGLALALREKKNAEATLGLDIPSH